MRSVAETRLVKVLITGGSGFLGRALARDLIAAGYEVRISTRGDVARVRVPGADVVQAAFEDAASLRRACDGCRRVFHVAARVGTWGPYEAFYRDNVLATKGLIEASRHTGVERIIYTSSPSVVIGKAPIRHADESMPVPRRFFNAYQRSKAETERVVLDANNVDGLTTTVLRPHAIWGPGDTQLAPRMIAAAQARRLPVIGDGTNRVSMVHVRDAARAHRLAGETKAAAGRTYFINDSEPTLIWTWVREVLRRLQLPAPSIQIPFWLAYAVATLTEAGHTVFRSTTPPTLTRYTTVLLGLDHYFDATRAARELGFASEVDPKQALEDLTSSLRIESSHAP